jgi:hypothetical protein
MNTRTMAAENCVPEPHPCSLKTKDLLDENDYQDLANCCQRHVCRLDGYCRCKKNKKECRFGYPFKLQEKTVIEFEEKKNSVRAHIYLKRNDSNMNMHNRLICHGWRGNVDMQIILDRHAAINYMVKYASKAEGAGQSLNQLFKDVIGPTTNEDNPQSKLKSIMLKSVAGKRDLGFDIF